MKLKNAEEENIHELEHELKVLYFSNAVLTTTFKIYVRFQREKLFSIYVFTKRRIVQLFLNNILEELNSVFHMFGKNEEFIF